MHFAYWFSLVLFNSAIAGPLDQIQKIYQELPALKMEGIPGNSAWAGRCLSTDPKKKPFGILFNFYVIHDPLIGDYTYGLPLTHRDRNHYFSLPPTEIKKRFDEIRQTQMVYAEELTLQNGELLSLNNPPAGKGYLREEEPYPGAELKLKMGIKVKQDVGKPPVYFFAMYCPLETGCRDFGYDVEDLLTLKENDRGAYCYADRQVYPLVSQPAVSPPVISPKPAPAVAPAPALVRRPSSLSGAPNPNPKQPSSNSEVPTVIGGSGPLD